MKGRKFGDQKFGNLRKYLDTLCVKKDELTWIHERHSLFEQCKREEKRLWRNILIIDVREQKRRVWCTPKRDKSFKLLDNSMSTGAKYVHWYKQNDNIDCGRFCQKG